MCGIVGVKTNNGAVAEIYESLVAMQNRGQDSAGIVTFDKRFHLKKGLGLVREVFRQENIDRLKGSFGIGQVRYATMGSVTNEEIQPFTTYSPYGIALTFNGTIYNSDKLKKELSDKDYRHVNTDNDGEVLLNLFAVGLERNNGGDFFEGVCKAVQYVYERARGGYSVVAAIAGKGIIAFRDPHGIRPLVWGVRESTFQPEHIFASENTMFEILNYKFQRDVEHGEVVFVDLQGKVFSKIIDQKEFRPCIFEYVYFARVDALLNGVSVYRSRLRMGQNLAAKIKRDYPNLEIDVVIPAPQCATTAGLACAHELGVRYTEGIVKNQMVGRTFIMPGQKIRQKANKYKLSVIDFEVKDKNVLVVDDSIVRGTVSRHIIQLMRKHGAKKVYFASTAPPLRYPDLYGIDLPTREEYIAYNKSIDEIRQSLGADELIYQDLDDLIEAVTRRGDLKFKRPHAAYFNGDYPTEGVTEEVLLEIERQRKAQKANLEGEGAQLI
ncbi:MAG: amidophosphoribosyltransferase [Candidatus Buchananbacteria bacterium CG10_big_fil_rev_8_21_14_0_10_42_9]|uniref:Amidophosphoribosyltransferase n=1 Tax=Candidatus Buchananbacteria bacterium CG10_big_fil_rev_8_21_14_0_10_42_9 TaxID=1974526 RepID=A0A2H0W160_9BACT|nr:MAG: amidophosphoribosyltransferase [Candidatus Buchananbacteria bacterium CG10_big_fil_rev_8_21_14_0_10_42_9]